MRLLAVLVATLWGVTAQPAWAWLETLPGKEDWPAIPDNAGMAFFLGTWEPQSRDGAYMEHGLMTLRPGGKIRYQRKKPYLATGYRVIEETPYYVTLMTRTVGLKSGEEYLSFAVLHPMGTNDPPNVLALNKCYPNKAELEGFSWARSDDEALRQVWRNSRSCNPDFQQKSARHPFFGVGDGGVGPNVQVLPRQPGDTVKRIPECRMAILL